MSCHALAPTSPSGCYLQHAVAVGIGYVCLQASKVGLVVMSKVKVFHAEFRIFYLHFLVLFGDGHEGVLATANRRRRNVTEIQ